MLYETGLIKFYNITAASIAIHTAFHSTHPILFRLFCFRCQFCKHIKKPKLTVYLCNGTIHSP